MIRKLICKIIGHKMQDSDDIIYDKRYLGKTCKICGEFELHDIMMKGWSKHHWYWYRVPCITDFEFEG